MMSCSSNMNISEILNQLQTQALRDQKLRQQFLETRKDQNPLSTICRLCRELGYEIYPMDIIAASEETYAAMKRSTNGGGENSPKLAGEEDFYEDFFVPLENRKQNFRD